MHCIHDGCRHCMIFQCNGFVTPFCELGIVTHNLQYNKKCKKFEKGEFAYCRYPFEVNHERNRIQNS